MLNDNEKRVIALIEQDIAYSDYFFRRVKNLKWFYLLKGKGFFLPQNIPQSRNNEFLFWNVLDYLERVSEQLEHNSQYGKELIDAINSIVQFSLHNKKINNYHIWRSCIKITKNLPNEIIKGNLNIKELSTWLDVWSSHSIGASYIISDIAETLLPKFFHDDYKPDYKYADLIIDVITRIKPSGKVRYLNQREDVVFLGQTYGIKEVFQRYSDLIGERSSLKALYILADRLNQALKFKQRRSYAIIEFEDEVFKILVARVELETGKIGFKEGFYNCIVKQYSQEQLQGVDRENDLYAFYHIEPANDLTQFYFEAINKNDMVSSIQEKLPSEIQWTKDKTFKQKIEDIFKRLNSDYSDIWLKSLLDGGREHTTDVDAILIIILRDVLLAKCKTIPSDGLKILESFLGEKYQFPVFRRLVLLCVDNYWTEYLELLDQVIELIPDILEKSDFEVELQDILWNHNSSFSPELKIKLKSLIDNVPDYYRKEGEKLSAYWKFKWLSPLRDNPDFQSLYQDAKQKAEPKDDKPYKPERSSFKSGVVIHRPPISKEEILQKSVADLVKYLSEFEGADFWHGAFEGEPDKEGLAEALRSAVIDDPKKFTYEINAFFDVGYFYLYRILWGLKDAWRAGKDLDWKKIFDFYEKYLAKGEAKILEEVTQAQEGDSQKGIYIWVVDEIVDLIREGCSNDERAFEIKYFDKVDLLFDQIFPLLKCEDHPDIQRDPLSYAMSTTLGKTVMAYVSFSLRVARATTKIPENWGKDKFERFLSKGIEGYIWLGCYLPQISYLDKEFAKLKIEYFDGKSTDDFKWQMFMEGYLYGSKVYGDLYPLMRENYTKALYLEKGFEEDVDKQLVEHICIGYLQLDETLNPSKEDIGDSLFGKLLLSAGRLGKQDRWIKVVDFFWMNTKQTIKESTEEEEDYELSSLNNKKILDFWSWSFNNQRIAKENLGEKYGSFLGRISELTILLDKIDDEKEKWLLLSAPYVEQETSFFIEYLTKFEDKESIERIGRIYLAVLEHATPEYRREDIELIVRRMYDKGNRQDAENICNTYGRRGVHFLKPIWEEYQKKGI
jgi:hypothetical protein